MKRQIDVVVPTWRKPDLVVRCLERLEHQTVPHTTFVVDNASGDETVELVRSRFPKAQVVELEENIGFGRAIAAGVREGSGEFVVLLNNDVEVEADFLAEIVKPFEDEKVGMVAGLTFVPDSEIVDSFGIELDPTLAPYNRLVGKAVDDQAGKLLGPSGGAAAYRRIAFEQAGGFDERLFAYGEDVDLALRLRLSGWQAAAVKSARAVHLGGASFGRGSRRQRYLAGFARGFLLRQYRVLRQGPRLRTLLTELLVVLGDLVTTRSAVALRGRIAGWRIAKTGPFYDYPAELVDSEIGFYRSLRRRAG